jgi:hypothetical protein
VRRLPLGARAGTTPPLARSTLRELAPSSSSTPHTLKHPFNFHRSALFADPF